MKLSQLTVLTLCSSVSSFTVNSNGRAIHSTKLHLSDRGWDNSNFLDALSGGQNAIDEANAQYQREAQARVSMNESRYGSMGNTDANSNANANADNFMSQNMEAPAIAVPNSAENEDNSAGGQRFRQMMEQAKQRNQQPPQMQQQPQSPSPPPPQQQVMQPPPPPSPMPQAPPMGQQPQQQQQQQYMDPQGYYQALQVWQQAMVAFQQFSATNPELAAQMTPPAPPPPPQNFVQQSQAMPQAVPQQQYQNPPPPQQQQQQQYQTPPETQPVDAGEDEVKSVYDYLPKRAGGNNDAYEVNNSADVYFAQLKRDSKVRIEARKKGDLETANKPFAEKGVVALKGLLSDELIAERRNRLAKNGGEFETSRDEMILPSHFQGDDHSEDKTSTGVSYKQRLMEAKKKRSQA